jgi:hypothetical protein
LILEVPDAAPAAAVCDNRLTFDLVVSCDTAIAHLAGGLGVPVWVALPFANDWRWLRYRTDTPWYPTMRLFRQEEPTKWESVFAAMAHELPALIERSRADEMVERIAELEQLLEQVRNVERVRDPLRRLRTAMDRLLEP